MPDHTSTTILGTHAGLTGDAFFSVPAGSKWALVAITTFPPTATVGTGHFPPREGIGRWWGSTPSPTGPPFANWVVVAGPIRHANEAHDLVSQHVTIFGIHLVPGAVAELDFAG